MKRFKKFLIRVNNNWIDLTEVSQHYEFVNYSDAEKQVLEMMEYFNAYEQYASYRFEYYMFTLKEVK
jgi:hypothetical protein